MTGPFRLLARAATPPPATRRAGGEAGRTRRRMARPLPNASRQSPDCAPTT